MQKESKLFCQREKNSIVFYGSNFPGNLKLASIILVGLFLIASVLLMPYTAMAEVGASPSTGNPYDYSGSGDWEGSAGNDQFTNNAGATVDGDINMTQGGVDEVTNHGTVNQSIIGGSTDGNTITNSASGHVSFEIIGSNNDITGADAGSNTITNNGTIDFWTKGSNNSGERSSGGSNTILINAGTTFNVYGSHNAGLGASGGSNTLTVQAGATSLFLRGSNNEGQNSSGGSNEISNAGTTTGIKGSKNAGENSSGGSNSIHNSGIIKEIICGGDNIGVGSSGGDNTINNSGTVKVRITGSNNQGDNSSGGDNIINNSGTVEGFIYGSKNNGAGSSGGNNQITNSGTVEGAIYGSRNSGMGGSFSGGGGNNRITNSGTVISDVIGNYNGNSTAVSGGNTLTNSGNIKGDLIGSQNFEDGSNSTGNSIENSGTVEGSIYGSKNDGAGSTGGDDTISNSGTVGGSILAADGTDTVTMEAGPETVGGHIDGGAGTDTLVLCGGTWTQNDAKIINFEKTEINATKTLTLNGTWTPIGSSVQVSGGTLNAMGTLTDQSWMVNSGTASISGATIAKRTLSVGSKGTLNTDSLSVSGKAHIDGAINSVSSYLSGEMRLNGSLNSPLTVARDGLLCGSGTVNGNVDNSGTISPGNSIGTMHINSTVTFNPGSTFVAEIAADGFDMIMSHGNVVINGGTLQASLQGSLQGSLFTDATVWHLIQADNGVSGQFDLITGQPESVVLSLSQSSTSNQLGVALNRRSYGGFARGDGSRGVGYGLDAVVPLAQNSGSEMETFLSKMDWSYSADEIAQALEALSPAMYDGFTAAGIQAARAFDGAMRNRTEQRLGDQIEAPGWSVWGKVLGGWTDQSADNGRIGYDNRLAGVAFGADTRLSEWFNLGLALGYTHSDLRWSQGSHGGNQESIHAGVYSFSRWGGFYVNGGLSFGSCSGDASRNISLEDYQGTARSDVDARAWQARLSGGYDWNLSGWKVGPSAGTNWLWLDRDGINENGADIFNLDVHGEDYSYYLTDLGIKASSIWLQGTWQWLFRAEIAWLHQFGEDGDITANFLGYGAAPFSVTGAERFDDALQTKLGMGLKLSQHVEVFLDYALLYADDSPDQTASIGLNWRF